MYTGGGLIEGIVALSLILFVAYPTYNQSKDAWGVLLVYSK